MEIRRLTTADAEAHREIRLRSVREHPEAYVASEAEERARTVEQFRQRIADTEGKDGDVIFGAFEDGKAVGVLGVYRPAAHRAKGRHIAMIWGVYVAPEVRRRGVGRLLMDAAIGAASKAEGIELLQLGVGVDNRAARALYESVGFETYGIEKHAIKLDDRYIDEELMALIL